MKVSNCRRSNQHVLWDVLGTCWPLRSRKNQVLMISGEELSFLLQCHALDCESNPVPTQMQHASADFACACRSSAGISPCAVQPRWPPRAQPQQQWLRRPWRAGEAVFRLQF